MLKSKKQIYTLKMMHLITTNNYFAVSLYQVAVGFYNSNNCRIYGGYTIYNWIVMLVFKKNTGITVPLKAKNMVSCRCSILCQ